MFLARKRDAKNKGMITMYFIEILLNKAYVLFSRKNDLNLVMVFQAGNKCNDRVTSNSKI